MRKHHRRKMTGLWDNLTPEQQAKALAYDGPENHGDPAFLLKSRGPVESAFESTLNDASDEFVIAVHDLTHAILSDRSKGGVKPPPRRMRAAVKIVRDEMARKGWQADWNALRDRILQDRAPLTPDSSTPDQPKTNPT